MSNFLCSCLIADQTYLFHLKINNLSYYSFDLLTNDICLTSQIQLNNLNGKVQSIYADVQSISKSSIILTIIFDQAITIYLIPHPASNQCNVMNEGMIPIWISTTELNFIIRSPQFSFIQCKALYLPYFNMVVASLNNEIFQSSIIDPENRVEFKKQKMNLLSDLGSLHKSGILDNLIIESLHLVTLYSGLIVMVCKSSLSGLCTIISCEIMPDTNQFKIFWLMNFPSRSLVIDFDPRNSITNSDVLNRLIYVFCNQTLWIFDSIDGLLQKSSTFKMEITASIQTHWNDSEQFTFQQNKKLSNSLHHTTALTVSTLRNEYFSLMIQWNTVQDGFFVSNCQLQTIPWRVHNQNYRKTDSVHNSFEGGLLIPYCDRMILLSSPQAERMNSFESANETNQQYIKLIGLHKSFGIHFIALQQDSKSMIFSKPNDNLSVIGKPIDILSHANELNHLSKVQFVGEIKCLVEVDHPQQYILSCKDESRNCFTLYHVNYGLTIQEVDPTYLDVGETPPHDLHINHFPCSPANLNDRSGSSIKEMGYISISSKSMHQSSLYKLQYTKEKNSMELLPCKIFNENSLVSQPHVMFGPFVIHFIDDRSKTFSFCLQVCQKGLVTINCLDYNDLQSNDVNPQQCLDLQLILLKSIEMKLNRSQLISSDSQYQYTVEPVDGDQVLPNESDLLDILIKSSKSKAVDGSFVFSKYTVVSNNGSVNQIVTTWSHHIFIFELIQSMDSKRRPCLNASLKYVHRCSKVVDGITGYSLPSRKVPSATTPWLIVSYWQSSSITLLQYVPSTTQYIPHLITIPDWIENRITLQMIQLTFLRLPDRIQWILVTLMNENIVQIYELEIILACQSFDQIKTKLLKKFLFDCPVAAIQATSSPLYDHLYVIVNGCKDYIIEANLTTSDDGNNEMNWLCHLICGNRSADESSASIQRHELKFLNITNNDGDGRFMVGWLQSDSPPLPALHIGRVNNTAGYEIVRRQSIFAEVIHCEFTFDCHVIIHWRREQEPHPTTQEGVSILNGFNLQCIWNQDNLSTTASTESLTRFVDIIRPYKVSEQRNLSIPPNDIVHPKDSKSILPAKYDDHQPGFTLIQLQNNIHPESSLTSCLSISVFQLLCHGSYHGPPQSIDNFLSPIGSFRVSIQLDVMVGVDLSNLPTLITFSMFCETCVPIPSHSSLHQLNLSRDSPSLHQFLLVITPEKIQRLLVIGFINDPTHNPTSNADYRKVMKLRLSMVASHPIDFNVSGRVIDLRSNKEAVVVSLASEGIILFKFCTQIDLQSPSYSIQCIQMISMVQRLGLIATNLSLKTSEELHRNNCFIFYKNRATENFEGIFITRDNTTETHDIRQFKLTGNECCRDLGSQFYKVLGSISMDDKDKMKEIVVINSNGVFETQKLKQIENSDEKISD